MAGAKKEAGAAGEAAAPEEAEVDSRGEVTVPFEGQDYVLRPSHAAIMAIEKQARPLFQLAVAAEQVSLTIAEQAICVVEMMKAYGMANPEDPLVSDYKGANVEKVHRLIFEASPYLVCRRLQVVLTGALFGGYTASGEVKAAATT